MEEMNVEYKIEDFIEPIVVEHQTTTRRVYSGMHIHVRYHEIYIFLKGNVDYFAEDTKKHLERGDMMIAGPNELHRPYINDTSPYERVVIHVTDHKLTELSTPRTNLLKTFQQIRSHFFHLSDEELELLLKNVETIKEYQSNQDVFGQDIIVQSYLNIILLQVINKLYREDGVMKEEISSFSPLISSAVNYVNQHFTEKITVQDIADGLNISRSYLSHVFSEYMGSSIWNYVLAKRLAFAQKLILEQRSITDACFEAGFNSYAHFNRIFMKTFNVSPKKYRENAMKQITIQLPT